MLHRACLMLLVQVLLLAGDSDGSYVRFKSGRGRATVWNNRGTGGSCLLDPPPADGMFVAMNKAALDYNGAHPAELCGSCIRVVNRYKSVVVKVINGLSDGGGSNGDLDISLRAWERLTSKPPGVLPDVTWSFVDCSVSGKLQYRFKEGSSAYWIGIQVRNYAGILTDLEVNGVHLKRTAYNFFMKDHGLGRGPFTIKSTFADGTTVVDYNIRLH